MALTRDSLGLTRNYFNDEIRQDIEPRTKGMAILINMSHIDDYSINRNLEKLIHHAVRDYEARIKADLEEKLHNLIRRASNHGERGMIEVRLQVNNRVRNQDETHSIRRESARNLQNRS